MLQVKRDERRRVALTLNGKKLAAEAEPRMLLSGFCATASAPPAPMSAASMACAARARC